MLTPVQFKQVSRWIIAAQCLGMMTGALFQNSFYLNRLINTLALLERTVPDAVRSKNQKYRLTEKGRTLIAPDNS